MFRSLVVLFLLMGIGLGSVANSQDYSVLPINDSFDLEKIKAEPEIGGDEKRAMSKLRQRISQQEQNSSQVFRTGTINSQFENYYKQVIVPQLTLYDDESLADLTEKHQKIIKDLATRVRSPQVRGYLVKDVYFPQLSQIAEGNYHPAVRYNAILTIGKLDEVIGKHRVAAPRAFRDSLPYLITKYNEFSDPKLAYMKFGAFKGIARIAGIEFQKQGGGSTGGAIPVLTALLGPKPAGMDQDLFLSMQKSAVQALGLLGDPANVDAMATLLKDEKAPIWTRLEAAIAISKTKSANFDSAKLDEIATDAGKFMHDVLRQEAQTLADTQKRIAILAARKKETTLGPPKGTIQGSGKSSGDSMQGAEDRSAGLASGGGGGSTPGSGGMSPGGGSGGMSPGGGSGGGRKSGRNRNSTELEDLPDYRIQVARRKIKTVALGLYAAFGTTNGTTGMLRWANTEPALLTKLSKIKEHIEAADKAAEVGLGADADIVESVTESIKSEFISVADSITQSLGLAPAKGNVAAKAGKKKKSNPGDSFLNN